MNQMVSKEWLLARMYEPDLVIVDCRFWLNDPHAGRERYNEAHIPRAVYLDLDEDLSAPLSQHGGRHPMPEPEQMAHTFGQAGLSQDDRIVIYDDNDGMIAARLWWMLTYLGHTQVFLLEQGYSAWKKAAFPITADQPVVIPKTFEARPQPELIATLEEVREIIYQDPSARVEAAGPKVLIDSRERKRYLGLEEPIDAKAGGIPNAFNYFWKEVLTEEGRLKPTAALEEHFSGLDKNQEIVVYCGSGVSACPNILALKQIGFKHVKLYPGGWSDWISYPDNPVAKGEE
ncbi:sulfurtransferase [Paenibacillus sanguinis]|uniref:sulfurtransferase n=1 Tax=Paenibacillus sanguinis TaxID=225906 RepID=UPI000362969D|nr:sulfurtransferase [Paenibacillus sanguinis]